MGDPLGVADDGGAPERADVLEGGEALFDVGEQPAVWIPKRTLLVVSTGDRVNGASNVFNLGPLDARTACKGVVDIASRRSEPEASGESP